MLTIKEYVIFIIFFSKRMYNTKKLTGFGWYFTVDQGVKIRSDPHVPIFYNHIFREPMNTFIRKTNFLHLETLLLPVSIFKNIPNWYCPVVEFGKYLFTAFDFNYSSNGLMFEMPGLT